MTFFDKIKVAKPPCNCRYHGEGRQERGFQIRVDEQVHALIVVAEVFSVGQGDAIEILEAMVQRMRMVRV